MKTLFSVGVGAFLILSAGAISLSQASRDVYHSLVNNYSVELAQNQSIPRFVFEGQVYQITRSHAQYYLNRFGAIPSRFLYDAEAQERQIAARKENLKERPFSERKGVFRLSSLQNSSEKSGRTQNPNYRGSRRAEHSARTDGNSDPNRDFRPTTSRLSGSWKNKTSRTALSFRQVNARYQAFQTFENDAFSVQIPRGWADSFDQIHFFQNPASEFFTVSIEKIDAPCTSLSFATCAITLSKDKNHRNPAEKIITSSRINRAFQYSDTILNQLGLQTATFTESFIGRAGNGQGEKYFARFFVKSPDGGTWLIETQADLEKAPHYLPMSKVIFDSFRLFGSVN